MQLTIEEKRKIDKALKAIVDDLLEIRKESGLAEIRMPIFTKIYTDDKLLRKKSQLLITCRDVTLGNVELYRGYEYMYSENSGDSEKNYRSDLKLIKSYPKLREEIMNRLNERFKEKEQNIALCDQIIGDIEQKRVSSIIIGLPDSLNQHTIEVEEYDSKKIGTIDFGDHIIQIITSSEIQLVKKENPSQKRKRK